MNLLAKVGLNVLCAFIVSSCSNKERITYVHQPPEYSKLSLAVTKDTLVFPTHSEDYTAFRSFNYLVDRDEELISYYDKTTRTIKIFSLANTRLKYALALESLFTQKKLKKVSVYTKSLDTILVNNDSKLYFMTVKGKVYDSINFQVNPYLSIASFENYTPAITIGDTLYAESRPRMAFGERKNLLKWKVIYQFNMKERESSLQYNLPEVYQENIFNYTYFDNSYCVNNNNNLVFSFCADTNIYETNLNNHSIAYFAKSHLQDGPINPVDMKKGVTGDDFKKSSLLNDEYGPIYFDRHNRRYLRVAKQKLPKEEYLAKQWRKQQSIIIFDEHFKIIGESKIDKSISLSFLFITKDGKIYVRTNINNNDALTFVRLEYSTDQTAIALNKRQPL